MKKIFNKSFGKIIKQKRKSLGITQKMLSDVMGINRATLATYEFGAINVPSYIAFLLCNVLGIDANKIFNFDTSSIRNELIDKYSGKLNSKVNRKKQLLDNEIKHSLERIALIKKEVGDEN